MSPVVRSPVGRGGGLVVIGAVFVLAIVTVRRPPPANGPPTGAPSSATPRATPFLPGAPRLPRPGSEFLLPGREAGVPGVISLTGGSQVALSTHPVRRALALVGLSAGTGPANQVVVVGDEGRLRVIDGLELRPAVDADGNQRSAVGAGTLSPDGTRAAFPQPDGLIVVDLVAGTWHTIALPGFNEYVVWLGDRIAVAQAGATVVVDPASDKITPVPWHGFDLVAADDRAAPVRELHEEAGAPTMLTWAGSSTSSAAVNTALTSPHWAGPGWAGPDWGLGPGDRVAAELVAAPTEPASAAVVIDADGTVRRFLVLGTSGPDDQPPNCCTVLGWLDADTVLLAVRSQVTRNGGVVIGAALILAWDLLEGGLSQVCRIEGVGIDQLSVSLARTA
ncbi:MAG: hypothetical protein ACM30G_00650 [Micromonosporaceae bacterium]